MNETFTFKKKFGQNFLKNSAVVQKIVKVANIQPHSLIIEVGPGAGALTKALAEFDATSSILAYEIDDSLEDCLMELCHQHSNVTVLFQDFLQSDLKQDTQSYAHEALYFVGNVPYYITTPILFHLIDSNLPFQKIVVMVQKEVGDRFCAIPGKREYNALTVLLHYYFTVKKEFIVDRNQFVPRPNVDSVVVSFERKEKKQDLKNPTFFKKLVHDSFQYKRKTLRNNLKNYDLDTILKVLETYHFDLNVRAEQLDVVIFVEIANFLVD